MPVSAGKLRHIIKIQQNQEVQLDDGSMQTQWVDVYSKTYASIEPLSAREFLASATQEMQVSARITVRYKPNIVAKMRILHGATVYNIEGVLPDADSGIEYLTLVCSTGVLDATQSHG